MSYRFWFIALFAVVLSPRLPAQILGGIVGEVKDASGAVVVGAMVSVTNTNTNAMRSTVSNEAGLYSSPGFANQGQASVRQGGDRGAQNMAIAGQRSEWNYFTLDGVNNTDPNFNSYLVLPSVDMLLEFKVQSGIYPAEFGHEASQINVS